LTCHLTTDPEDDASFAVGKDKALGCAA